MLSQLSIDQNCMFEVIYLGCLSARDDVICFSKQFQAWKILAPYIYVLGINIHLTILSPLSSLNC